MRFQSGLPFISRVPMLGALFGRRGNERLARELPIVITLHIWQPGLALPTPR